MLNFGLLDCSEFNVSRTEVEYYPLFILGAVTDDRSNCNLMAQKQSKLIEALISDNEW